MRAQLMGDGCSSMRHDVGVTTPGDPASPPSGPWDPGRDDDGVVERREPQSWSPDPLVPARGVPAPGTGGQVSWTPENVDAQWTAMEQQLRDDESLERALSTGCARINLGTAALENPEWTAKVIAEHGDVVAVGLDVRGSSYFDYHHTEADTLDKIDPAILADDVAAIAVFAYVAADLPTRLDAAE